MLVVRPIEWIKKISYHYTCPCAWIIFEARETFGLTFVYSLPRLPYNNFLPTCKIQSRLTTFTREEIQEHIKDMCGILLWLSDSACTIVSSYAGRISLNRLLNSKICLKWNLLSLNPEIWLIPFETRFEGVYCKSRNLYNAELALLLWNWDFIAMVMEL